MCESKELVFFLECLLRKTSKYTQLKEALMGLDLGPYGVSSATSYEMLCRFVMMYWDKKMTGGPTIELEKCVKMALLPVPRCKNVEDLAREDFSYFFAANLSASGRKDAILAVSGTPLKVVI